MSGLKQEIGDVLVVGAGPVGLAMAAELYRHGRTCRLIETKTERDHHSKAISISGSTMQVFDHMGVAEAFVGKGTKVRDIVVNVAGRRFFRLDYRQLERRSTAPYPFLLSLPQPQSEALLEDHLARVGGEVCRGSKLLDMQQERDYVRVTVETADGLQQQECYRYVVGCDGSRSRVRQLAGVEYAGEKYPISFVHGDFVLDWDGPKDQVHYFVSKERFALIIPMAGGSHRVVAQVSGSNPEQDYPVLSADLIASLLVEAGAPKMTLSQPEWLSHAKLYHLLADKIRVDRVFLAGDAFHLFSPIGGQGMNTGVQDAFNLAWKIAYVLQEKAAPALLDSYESERHPVAAGLLQSGDDSTRLLLGQAKGPTLTSLQAAMSPLMRNRSLFRNKFPAVFSGLAQDYPTGKFLRNSLPQDRVASTAARAGRRAPDGVLETTSGDRLFHKFRSSNHVLLVIDSTGERSAALEELRAKLSEIDCPWLDLVVCLPSLEATSVMQACGAQPGDMFLIRPDRYIEFSGTLAEQGQLLTFLTETYNTRILPKEHL